LALHFITMLASRCTSTTKITALCIIPKAPLTLINSLPYGRMKSTLLLKENIHIEEQEVRSMTKNPIPDFNNARITFEDKSMIELLRAATCFQTCRIPVLVENAERILLTLRKIVGDQIVDSVMKTTFYGHFCAGENRQQIQPVIEKLKKTGVGSILDYAAENDGPVEVIGSVQSKLGTINRRGIVAREYDYKCEEQCDQHMSDFLQCINDVAVSSEGENNNGYAAIKVTALGNPKLLARLSTAINEAKRLFSIFDTDGDGFITREEFEIGYNRFFVDGEVRIKETFQEFDPLNRGFIDYITWSMMLSPKDLPKITKSCQQAGRLSNACPTHEEIELLDAVYNRGCKLAKEAAKSGVRLLIDAEQVRYQPAIDNLVLGLQRRFNMEDKPVVYNTYQLYLRDALERLRTDVTRSERFGFHFGAKLVRGAYMESERELAKELNFDDPIHQTIEETHKFYDNAVNYLLRHSSKTDLNVEMMCATHNQASIINAIESMNYFGIDRSASTICFAQLYGMSDQLTFNLGKNGYRSYKYVPYGKVEEVMPYLLRRARENSAIIGGATEENNRIRAEVKRRLNVNSIQRHENT